MTEEEWLKLPLSADKKWRRIRKAATNRKQRLFAVACCRKVWHLIESPQSRESVDVGELFADGNVSAQTMSEAHERANEIGTSLASGAARDPRAFAAFAAWFASHPVAKDAWTAFILSSVAEAEECSLGTGPRLTTVQIEAEVLRVGQSYLQLFDDIFGNPFRPVAFDPRWRTSDVVGLAQAISNDKAFQRMPVLADALMDAGCEDEQIISHCRGDGPHVRGCWVVDLILERT